MQGVNLGNWLVTEPWMDPRVFADLAAEDEESLRRFSEGEKRLKAHRQQYIQEADICWLAERGVKLLRLPIGFWTVRGDDIQYVDWLFRMAEKYKMNVLLCLHGAPGSQNGNDHSGKKGRAAWFDDASFRQETTEILIELAQRYRNSRAFWGLELLNEPNLSWKNYWILRRFYQRTYKSLKKVLRAGAYTVFSDSYHPLLMAGMLRGNKQHPVAMDIHWYSFVSWWPKHSSAVRHLRQIRWRRWTLWLLQRVQPVIIGEWSAILPLEKVPSRDLETLEKQYYLLQKKIYRQALAQCYWSYITKSKSSWNFRYVTEKWD